MRLFFYFLILMLLLTVTIISNPVLAKPSVEFVKNDNIYVCYAHNVSNLVGFYIVFETNDSNITVNSMNFMITWDFVDILKRKVGVMGITYNYSSGSVKLFTVKSSRNINLRILNAEIAEWDYETNSFKEINLTTGNVTIEKPFSSVTTTTITVNKPATPTTVQQPVPTAKSELPVVTTTKSISHITETVTTSVTPQRTIPQTTPTTSKTTAVTTKPMVTTTINEVVKTTAVTTITTKVSKQTQLPGFDVLSCISVIFLLLLVISRKRR